MVFTRGNDNISMGASTFMVEMNETAAILNNITENSLSSRRNWAGTSITMGFLLPGPSPNTCTNTLPVRRYVCYPPRIKWYDRVLNG